MTRSDQLRAELALAEAEDAMIAAKSGKDPDAYRDAKNTVRELRAAARADRNNPEGG